MGYRTEYKIQLDFLSGISRKEQTEFRELIQQELSNIEYGDISEILMDWSQPMKWYDHDDDMRRISVKYPMVIFTLMGKGEESDDLWWKYYLAGRRQFAPAKIFYDSFNPLKLEEDESDYRAWAKTNNIEVD